MMHRPQRRDTAEGPWSRTRGRSTRVVATAVMAALALGAAACSSSTATTTTVTFNHATYQSDIGKSYDTLFNLANPNVTAKVAVVQDGSKVKAALDQALTSSLASSSAGTKIDSTSLLTSSKCKTASLPYPCAKVVYDINGPTGSAVLPNSQGYAVFIGGHWLVAKATICGLLGLFYQASGKSGSPPGC